MNIQTGLRLGGVAIAAVLLAGCSPSVASIDCGEMVTKAKEGTANDAVKITDVRNVEEESRTETEARCRGEAQLSNNETSPVYLRAYREAEGGNVMVQWSPEPYNEAQPAQ